MTELQLVYLISFLVNLLDLNIKNYILFTMTIWLPFLSLGQIITHCNVHGLGQLVGLTIILTVVIIVMNYMIYMKPVNNISPEAIATNSDMNKHYKIRSQFLCVWTWTYLVKLVMEMDEKMVSFLMNLMLDLNRQNDILLIMMILLLEP